LISEKYPRQKFNNTWFWETLKKDNLYFQI
jgi:hypothetical protein